MQLYHWRGAEPNFGDELNLLLWPRLMPGFFDDDGSSIFLGIGSVLDARHTPLALKLVAGAGYGGYQPLPKLDRRWRIHWVRGPLTARALDLPPQQGVGDPAMLLCHAGWPKAACSGPIGFMPHFESAGAGAWHQAAAAADLRLIDPRGSPAEIIAAISQSRLLLSEALHGVIVADTLRVPWIAIEPQAPIHRAKWHDWGASLGLGIEFRHVGASSLFERLALSRMTSYRTGRRLLAATEPMARSLCRENLIARAAGALRRASQQPPQLSTEASLDRCQTQMLERIEAIRRSGDPP